MNLTELRAEVVTLTRRPDLDTDGRILLAVRRATLKLHTIDYFYKDLFETTITFPDALALQDYDLPGNIPRFRSIKFLRQFDPVGATPGKFFKKVDPQNVLDDYAVSRENIWYIGGDTLHLRYETTFTKVLAGMYLYPDFSVATYSSWIARDYPYAIVNEAAAAIFKMIGKSDESRALREDNAENIALLRISGIQETPEVDL